MTATASDLMRQLVSSDQSQFDEIDGLGFRVVLHIPSSAQLRLWSHRHIVLSGTCSYKHLQSLEAKKNLPIEYIIRCFIGILERVGAYGT
jgi:hypothetical protein